MAATLSRRDAVDPPFVSRVARRVDAPAGRLPRGLVDDRRGCAATSSPTRCSTPCGDMGVDGGWLELLAELRRAGRPASGSRSRSRATRWGWAGRPRSTPPLSRRASAVVAADTGLGLVPDEVDGSTWWRGPRPRRGRCPTSARPTARCGSLHDHRRPPSPDLDVARWRPEVADELMDLAPTGAAELHAPPGDPARCARRWPCGRAGRAPSSSSRSRTTAARCRRTRSRPAETPCDRSSRPPAGRWSPPAHRRRGRPASHCSDLEDAEPVAGRVGEGEPTPAGVGLDRLDDHAARRLDRREGRIDVVGLEQDEAAAPAAGTAAVEPADLAVAAGDP